MNLQLLEPEVAGELGENTIFNSQGKITFLHYDFQGWLGDELMETTPCFIVTEKLANSIQSRNLTGAVFEDIQYTVSELFRELHPDRFLPVFKRLIPLGKVNVQGDTFYEWSGDDFCLSEHSCLVVTDRAFDILRSHQIDNCDVKQISARYPNKFR